MPFPEAGFGTLVAKLRPTDRQTVLEPCTPQDNIHIPSTQMEK